MSKKDITDLRRQFEGKGWTVSPTKGDHLHWKHEASGQVITTASTPSDWRAKINIKAALKRAEQRSREMEANVQNKAIDNDAFFVSVSYYKIGGDYGFIFGLPLDAVPANLRALNWRISVSEKNFILYQTPSGNSFSQRSGKSMIYRTNAGRVGNWPMLNYKGNHAAEPCRAVIAPDAGGRSTIRIALPEWLRKWYATRRQDDQAAVPIHTPEQEAPVLQATERGLLPPAASFAPAGGNGARPAKVNLIPPAAVPAVNAALEAAASAAPEVATLEAAEKEATKRQRAGMPMPVPVQTPKATDPEQAWRDACALCDMINEHLNYAPAGLEFFWDGGRLGVKRVTVEEYRPKR